MPEPKQTEFGPEIVGGDGRVPVNMVMLEIPDSQVLYKSFTHLAVYVVLEAVGVTVLVLAVELSSHLMVVPDEQYEVRSADSPKPMVVYCVLKFGALIDGQTTVNSFADSS